VSSGRVLVVDDSPTILKVVSAILSRHGFEPASARDGLAGIELLKRGTPFDLVLLDFVMPRMNGYQFCRELRSNPDLKALPVVLMSAKGDRIRDQFVQQTGAVDAITKPFDARALVAVIQGALARAAAGKARRVPDASEMPDDDTSIGDDEPRPSLFPKKLRWAAEAALARHVADVVTPVVVGLDPNDRLSPKVVEESIARALASSSLDELFFALREASSASSREVLAGDLAIIPLAEVLQMLQMQRQTGVMRVKGPKRELVISVRDGQMDLARLIEAPDVSGRPVPHEFRLGRYFIEQGVATRADVDAALSRALESKKTVGQELVDAGVVTAEARFEALSRQSSELVYDLLRWPQGRFWFSQDPPAAEADEARLGIGIAGLLLEGFRRMDEWRLMESTIVWDQVVAVDPALLANVVEQLTRSEKLVLDAIDGQRTITEVVAESHLSSFDAVKVVHQFLRSRVLRVVDKARP
jgi:CheY-like chemotaxis protein